jgi:hypothetical protein
MAMNKRIPEDIFIFAADRTSNPTQTRSALRELRKRHNKRGKIWKGQEGSAIANSLSEHV